MWLRAEMVRLYLRAAVGFGEQHPELCCLRSLSVWQSKTYEVKAEVGDFD